MCSETLFMIQKVPPSKGWGGGGGGRGRVGGRLKLETARSVGKNLI